jgi:hypothetical protein
MGHRRFRLADIERLRDETASGDDTEKASA